MLDVKRFHVIRSLEKMIILALVLCGLALGAESQRPYSRCKCMPDTPCWPTAQEWRALNVSVSGRLMLPKPTGYPCYRGAGYNTTACSVLKQSTTNAYFRRDLPGSQQNVNWEDTGEEGRCAMEAADGSFAACRQGRVPVYGVQVMSVKDVQAAVNFATRHNLRLVVKSTGHDYLGRSSAKGGFLIWMQKFRGITHRTAFVPQNCPREPATPALTVTGGTGWGEVYDYVEHTFGNKYTVLGGNAATVGAAGGFVFGGGHGAQSPWLGLAVDNVLQFEVVTADGRFRVVNKCQDPDLFWALRGGGGGTFGVVTSVTHKLNAGAEAYTGVALLAYSTNHQEPSETQLEALYEVWASYTPILEEARWGGYFMLMPGAGLMISLVAPMNQALANRTVTPLLRGLAGLQSTHGISIAPLHPGGGFTIPFKTFRQWHSWWATLMSPATGTDVTGGRTYLGSRLIPVSALSNPRQFAQNMVQAIRINGGWGLLGHFVNGKGVRERDNQGIETSVTPSWRRSVYHMVLIQGWAHDASDQQIEGLKKTLNEAIQVWRDAYPDAGAYGNEACVDEPRWQEAFWGAENYGRLYRIKLEVDPDGLFVCPECVGSELWDKDGICQK